MNNTELVKEMTEKEMISFYKLERQVQEYAFQFFDVIGSLSNSSDDKNLDSKVLPIVCYDCLTDYIKTESLGVKPRAGHFTPGIYNDRQGVIYIGLDRHNDTLDNDLRRSIRHEIIHYCLWALELNYEDNSLEFWCVAYAYDAHPYKAQWSWLERKFEAFKKVYDESLYKYRDSAIMGNILSEVLASTKMDDDKWNAKLKRIANKYDKKYMSDENADIKREKNEYIVEVHVYDDSRDDFETDVNEFLNEFLGGRDYQVKFEYGILESDIEEDDMSSDFEILLARIKVMLLGDIDEDGLRSGLEELDCYN